MATAIYKRGQIEMISHTVAGAAVTVDECLVIDRNLAVARNAGAIGDVIQCAITGVWVLPKIAGAEIAAGEPVLWDLDGASTDAAVDDNLAAGSTGDLENFGVAIEDAGNGVETVKVLLTPNAASIA